MASGMGASYQFPVDDANLAISAPLAENLRHPAKGTRMELTRNLRHNIVAQLKPTPPHAVAPDATIGDAVRLMRSKHVGCLLVCDGKKLVGILTERDVLTRVLGLGKPISDTVDGVMTRDPRTVGLRDPIRRALSRMEKGGYRHLPVVDEAGKAVGILSVKRVVHYLAEHFASAVYNQPPQPHDFPAHRGGA